MQNQIETIGQLSLQAIAIIFGTFFFLVGLLSALIALLRKGKDIKILIWLAAWSGAFGIRALVDSTLIKIILPPLIQNLIPAIDAVTSYLILVFASLTWFYLVRGKVRSIINVVIIVASVIAVLGIVWFFVTGNSRAFMLPNSLLAAFALILFVVVLLIKKLSDQFLVFHDRGVLIAGSTLFVVEALYTNLSNLFGNESFVITGWLGFAVLILALFYTAAKMIFTNERRLIQIESEMETARQIQSSILPDKIPEAKNLKIASAYYPMTTVAGDFYDFIEINDHETGFLVADVSGHGVPAALIASMIKIAMQSVRDSAKNPGEVLRLLNKILVDQLHGQFVTAAYLYINSDLYTVRYSAAGHPPLLYWNSSEESVESIESNGLILGISKEQAYPVREFSFNKKDRFLIYSDGLIEANNSSGDEFGNYRLGELIRANSSTSVKELSNIIFDELNLWRDKKESQQDDLTWIIIDCQ